MSTNLNPNNRCPSCGKPMPEGVLAGLCPACLFAQGVETERIESHQRPRFEPPKLEVISRLFPQLEVQKLLGAGGMGAVYKARQPALDRLVALKVLPAGGGVGSTERFNREARALARLSHPSIVTVHEFGQVEGLHYFIMEFVDGANLRQLEKTSRLSPREALQIIPQICDALQYAHDEGVVHRDIKPENVLVDRKGRVKIADFGLAKIADPDPAASRLTMEGQVMGTPHYMAPEQVERPLSVDHRADIYALGVVFYEMLTGDLPLGKFAPPSRKVQVDVRLDDIVLRALENDPERRYQQASEVKEGVATIVASPAHSSPAEEEASEPSERSVRWLNIPVAIERSGEREIDFQGAMTAIFVVMGTAAVAHMFVRWAAGREHALSSLVTLAGILTVVFGIRRAMSRPFAAEHRIAARRFAWDALTLAGLVAFIIGSHFAFVRWIEFKGAASRTAQMPPDRVSTGESSRAAGQIVQVNPATGAWFADLPGGGTIELLAMGEPDAAPNGWWTPDGAPVTNTTFAVRDAGSVFAPAGKSWDLIFRVANLPGATQLINYDCAAAFNMGGGGEVYQNGKPMAGGRHLRAAWAPDAKQAQVRVGFALGSWQRISTHFPPGRSASWNRERGLPDLGYVLHDLIDTDEGARATFALGEPNGNRRTRLIAVDAAGQEYPATGSTGTRTKDSTLVTHTFAGVKAAAIRQIHVQGQPIHWVTFQSLALVPTRAVPPPQPPGYGPVTEVTFDELLDLDTGRKGTFPPRPNDGGHGGNPLAGLDENFAWMQEQGFDIEARPGTLGLLGVRLVYLDAREWESLTASELGYRLRALGTLPTVLQPPMPQLPVHVGFRTREGGTGLLQIISYPEPGIAAKVRIKLVHP